jgi:hypothetical protein
MSIVQEAAYPAAGKLAREMGIVWKGDVPLHNKYGKVYYDIAHFEYHPQMTLAMARRAAGRFTTIPCGTAEKLERLSHEL